MQFKIEGYMSLKAVYTFCLPPKILFFSCDNDAQCYQSWESPFGSVDLDSAMSDQAKP